MVPSPNYRRSGTLPSPPMSSRMSASEAPKPLLSTRIATPSAPAMAGDRVTTASSSRRWKFNLPTLRPGLLCARRILKELKLDTLYEGEVGDEVNGEHVDIYMNDGEYIDDEKRPDLGALRAASRTVGEALRPGAIVVYESTVYPGVTEEMVTEYLYTKGDPSKPKFPEWLLNQVITTTYQGTHHLTTHR